VEFDGDVFAATCREGGSRGNIYREGFSLQGQQEKWLTCSQASCPCIPDMYAPKVKRLEQVPADFSKFRELKWSPSISNGDTVFSHHAIDSKVLIWELGRRCNYACTYCYPNSRSSTEPHKNIETLFQAADRLQDQWLIEEAGHILLLGGEPTVHPKFLELVRYIQSKNASHEIVTVTNGSRSPQYYSELFSLSSLAFSAHLEYLATPSVYEKFVENISACLKLKRRQPVLSERDLQVRIMLKPGSLDLAIRLQNEIENLPGAQDGVRVMIDYLHHTDARVMLSTYSQKELDFGNYI